MINIAYLPNIFFDDWVLTLKVLFQPWLWKRGKAEKTLTIEIEKILGGQVFLFTSGRGALWAILKSYGIGKDDEVIIQAFTCVAVIDPILAVGASPVYIDINDNYNLDTGDLKRKITAKTKAIIVQHTFGIPAEIKEIVKIAHEKKILVIEDLAHVFGNEYQGQQLGTFADACFLSFGRTKVISSMFGGAAVINDMMIQRYGKKKIEVKNKVEYPSNRWLLKQLFHQIIFFLLKPIYNFLGIGKGILLIMSRLKITSREVEQKEKQGEMVDELTRKMPNGLCLLALHQLQKLDCFLNKRKEISQFYQENLDKNKFKFPLVKTAYLRLPVELKQCHNGFLQNKKELLQKCKKQGIYLGDWYSQPVAPKKVNLNKIGYKQGCCPKAEEKNKVIINLPTNPTLSISQIKRITEAVNELGN